MMTRHQELDIFFNALRFGLLFILFWLKVDPVFSAQGGEGRTSIWMNKRSGIISVIRANYLLPNGSEHTKALKQLLIVSQYLAFNHKCGFNQKTDVDVEKCNKVFEWLVLASIATDSDKNSEKNECKKITQKECTGAINHLDNYLQMKVPPARMHSSLGKTWDFYNGEKGPDKTITIRQMGQNFGNRVNNNAEKIKNGLIKWTSSRIVGTEKDESDVDDVYRGFFEMVHSILPAFKAVNEAAKNAENKPKDLNENGQVSNEIPQVVKPAETKVEVTELEINNAEALNTLPLNNDSKDGGSGSNVETESRETDSNHNGDSNSEDSLSLNNDQKSGGSGSKVKTESLGTDSNDNGSIDSEKNEHKYDSIKSHHSSDQSNAGEVKVIKKVPWYKNPKVLVPGIVVPGSVVGGIMLWDDIKSIINSFSQTDSKGLTPRPTIKPKRRPPGLGSEKLWHYFWLYFGVANLLGSFILCCYVFRKGKGKLRFVGWKALCRSACYGFWNGLIWLKRNLFVCLRVIRVDTVCHFCCCCCPCYYYCTRAMRRPLPKKRRTKSKKSFKSTPDSAWTRQSRKASTSYSSQKPSTFQTTSQTSDQYTGLSSKPSNTTFSTNAFPSQTPPSMSFTSPRNPPPQQFHFSPQANVHRLSPPSPSQAGSPIASAPRISFASPPPNLTPNLNAMRPLSPPSPSKAGSPIASPLRVNFASPPPNLTPNLNTMCPMSPPRPTQIASPPGRPQTPLALNRQAAFQVGSPTGRQYSPSAPPNLQPNQNAMRPMSPPRPTQIASPPGRPQTPLALNRQAPFQVGSPTGRQYSPSAPPFSPTGQTPPSSPRNGQR